MKTNRLKLLMIITGFLFLVDWILGALQANGIIPTWTFLIANCPAGLIFVWMEYSWSGSYYLVFGHRIGDIGSLMVFIFAVLVQAYIYYLLFNQGCEKRRLQTSHPVS